MIPFCFPIFYHGLIAKRTRYSQPDVINILLSGQTESEVSSWDWSGVDRIVANKYINGAEAVPADRSIALLELSDKELLERFSRLNIRDIKTTISAFHVFLQKYVTVSQENLDSLENCIQTSEDPYRYYVIALKISLQHAEATKEFITKEIKEELHNPKGDIPYLFSIKKEAQKDVPDTASISMTPDKTFLSKIIGRDEFVQSVCDKLKKERGHIQLAGMGGIGKSEILRKAYSWFLDNTEEHSYTHIAYLYYSGNLRLALSDTMNYPGKESNANPIEYLKGLANNSKVLLFIDDVRNQKPDKNGIYEKDASFEEIAGSNISILFASRIIRTDFSLVNVKALPIESCVDIFLREYNANIGDDFMGKDDTECYTRESLTVEDKKRLVRIIDGRAGLNTLVIKRLGAMARDYSWTLTKLEEKLIEKNFNIPQGLTADNAEYLDVQTLQDELNKLYDYGEIKENAERSVLEGFTLLADIPTDIDTCIKWFHVDAGIDEDKCRIVLMRLMRSSWLLNTKTVLNGVTVANYSMHNIVREAVRSQANISKEEHRDLIWKAWVKLLLDVRIKKETDIKWGTKVHAEPGECVRFRIGVQNRSSEMFRNLVLRDLLPDGLSYVEGSTMIFNTAHPKGVTLSDKIIHDNGINIGDYAPGANAWIYFNAVTSEEPRDRNMIYRNVIQATVGSGTSKETFVDVLIEASEAL